MNWSDMNWSLLPLSLSFCLMVATLVVIGVNAGNKDTYSYDKSTIGMVFGFSGAAAIALIIGLFLYISRFPASAITILAIVCSFNLFASLAAIGVSVLIKTV